MLKKDKTKQIVVFSAKDFRKWLEKNHDKEKKVEVLIHKKHTGKPFPTHRELIEEAICFGWIDTTIKRIDEDTYIRTFARRTKNSTWSNNTLSYAKKLTKEGRMTKEGLRFYQEGLKKPTHDHGIPKNPNMPKELKNALSKNKKIEDAFKTLAPSKKKMLYRWVLSGKLPETRLKRINKIIKAVKEGDRDIF